MRRSPFPLAAAGLAVVLVSPGRGAALLEPYADAPTSAGRLLASEATLAPLLARALRAEALKLFTLWPAWAAFEEKARGSIEVGKLADFTVLSADIMEIPAPEILQTRCVMTIIGGEVVWGERG